MHPPSPYRVRRASLADVGEVEELVNAALKEDIGMILYAPGELRDMWAKNGLDGCVIVVDEDGEPAGCLLVETEGEPSLYFEDYVLSAHRGRRLGEFLIGRAEDHARRMARETQRSIEVTTNVNNDRGRAVLADLGYELENRDYAMFMDLEPGRPVTTWPSGIRLRPYRDGIDDDLMHETMVAGFGDDWPRRRRPDEMAQHSQTSPRLRARALVLRRDRRPGDRSGAMPLTMARRSGHRLDKESLGRPRCASPRGRPRPS